MRVWYLLLCDFKKGFEVPRDVDIEKGQDKNKNGRLGLINY